MAKEVTEKDLSQILERVTRLEVKVEQIDKRIDSLSNYAKEIYNYLQKQSR